MVLDDGPCGLNPFRAVKRIFPCDTLAPPVDAVTMCREQQDASAVHAAKARLKEMDERHLDLAQCDGFESHGKSVASGQRLVASARRLIGTGKSPLSPA